MSDTDHSGGDADDGTDDDETDALDAIADELGTVEVSDGRLKQRDPDPGERFGYDG